MSPCRPRTRADSVPTQDRARPGLSLIQEQWEAGWGRGKDRGIPGEFWQRATPCPSTFAQSSARPPQCRARGVVAPLAGMKS